MLATAYLYWSLVDNLKREDNAFLADEIQECRRLLHERPNDEHLLVYEIRIETGASHFIRYYARLLDNQGHILLETPGMADVLPVASFPAAIATTEVPTRGTVWQSGEYIKRGGLKRQVYAEKLVQGGMFAHCRNPLYVGNIMILLGLGMASNSVLFLTVCFPFFLFAYWAIIAAEENYLRNKFGQDFDNYCGRVNRLLPKLSGLGQTLSGMRFNWRRLIKKEYGSTYIWLAGIILVILKNIWLSGDYRHGGSLETGLWVSLAFLTLGYAVARFLKKKGLLKDALEPVS